MCGEAVLSSANNAPSLGPLALLWASGGCEYSFSVCLQISAGGMGRGAFLPQAGAFVTLFSVGETWQHNPKRWEEEKTLLPPPHTHTAKAEGSLLKGTCSIHSCCSQSALLIKTLSFSFLQPKATYLNQQALTSPPDPPSPFISPALRLPERIWLGAVS